MNDLKTRGFLEGDCDCISTFSAAVLRVLYPKISSRFIAIIYTPGNTAFEHVYVQVLIGDDWNDFDMTVKPGTSHRILERMTQDV